MSTTISEPGVGTYVNKIGYASGQTGGNITSTNATMTNTSGVTRTNMVEVKNVMLLMEIVVEFFIHMLVRQTLAIHWVFLSAGDGYIHILFKSQCNKIAL